MSCQWRGVCKGSSLRDVTGSVRQPMILCADQTTRLILTTVSSKWKTADHELWWANSISESAASLLKNWKTTSTEQSIFLRLHSNMWDFAFLLYIFHTGTKISTDYLSTVPDQTNYAHIEYHANCNINFLMNKICL